MSKCKHRIVYIFEYHSSIDYGEYTGLQSETIYLNKYCGNCKRQIGSADLSAMEAKHTEITTLEELFALAKGRDFNGEAIH